VGSRLLLMIGLWVACAMGHTGAAQVRSDAKPRLHPDINATSLAVVINIADSLSVGSATTTLRHCG
jgi:hypothetical protein